MKIYLDDDSVDALLIKLLNREGHDVVAPADVGKAGASDPVHFTFAVANGRTVLTHNHDDYQLLHEFLLAGGGHHHGLLVVRKDNDPTKDLKPPGIVRALRKLLASGSPIVDRVNILNHWR